MNMSNEKLQKWNWEKNLTHLKLHSKCLLLIGDSGATARQCTETVHSQLNEHTSTELSLVR